MTEAGKPVPRLMTDVDVARILRVTERTLENWRLNGSGPAFVCLGRQPQHKVVYDWHAVEAWLAERREA
jgi:phage terminase Nu1 subunit (DNA packaging protein)